MGYNTLLSLNDSYEKFLILEYKLLKIGGCYAPIKVKEEYNRLYKIYNDERMKRYEKYLK